MLHTEGTISYISILIKKKTMSMTRVRMGESQYYLASFWTQKGKVRLLTRRGSLFADGGKFVIFPEGLSYKAELILSKCKYKHLEFETCGILRYMGVYHGTVSKGGTQL